MTVTTAFAPSGRQQLLCPRGASIAAAYIFSRRSLRSALMHRFSPVAPCGGRSLQGSAFLLCCLRCAPAMIKVLGVGQWLPRLLAHWILSPALLAIASPCTATPPA